MSKASIANGAVVGSVAGFVSALTPGVTVAIDASQANVFTLTPAQAETLTVSNFQNGERMTLVVLTSGTNSYTLTFGTGFKTTGTLATGTVDSKTFVMEFVAANGVMNEVSRTTAM